MASGYWLEPTTGELFEVTTHDEWLLIPDNQQRAGLSAAARKLLPTFDRQKEIDEIRMVGVMSGLIRLREYRTRNDQRISIQFFVEEPRVAAFLKAVRDAIPSAFGEANHFLTLHNLKDDSFAKLFFDDFSNRLLHNENVLNAGNRENEQLRKKMKSLFSSAVGDVTCKSCKYKMWLVGIGLGMRCKHPKNRWPDALPRLIPNSSFSCLHYDAKKEQVDN